MLEIDLSGKTALITGATGELGRTMARTLAGAGADMVLHYHSAESRAHQLARELEALGRRVATVQADVGTAAGVQRIAAHAAETVGMPDIVVLNAVQSIQPWSSVLEEELEDYESQFRTCVLQGVLLAKAFVPHMIQNGWGRFIALNTECTMQMMETQSAYVAGKRGMDGLLRVLAREIGRHNITVNQVAPGWIRTEKEASAPLPDEGYCAIVPLRRRGTEHDVAKLIAFLASDLAAFIHGAFIPVAGGTIMPTV